MTDGRWWWQFKTAINRLSCIGCESASNFVMPFSNEEKADMILALGAACRQGRQAARIFQSWHPGTCPSVMTIINTYESLKKTGRFARKRHRAPVISDEVRSNVLSFMAANPHANTHTASAQLGVSNSTAWRILNTAGLHHYHVQLHQSLHSQETSKTD